MPVQYRIRPRLCPVGMAGEPDADAGRATALFSLLLGEPRRQRLLGLAES